jgi:anti-anti-sigma factor
VASAGGKARTKQVLHNDYRRHPDRRQRIVEDGTLKVRIDEQLEEWSVWVFGELDDANVGTLDAELHRLDGNKAITLDLSRLEFMGAAGIELFVRLAEEMRLADRRIQVVHCSAPVARLLSMCGLDAAEHPLSGGVPADERSALGDMGLQD